MAGTPVVATAALAETGGTTGASTGDVAGQEAETAADEGPEATAGVAAPAADEAAAAQTSAWVAPTAMAVAPTDWRSQRQAERAARRAARGRGDSFGAVIFGLILVLVGGFFLVQMYFPDIDTARFWPAVLVVIGVVFLVFSFRAGSGKPQP